MFVYMLYVCNSEAGFGLLGASSFNNVSVSRIAPWKGIGRVRGVAPEWSNAKEHLTWYNSEHRRTEIDQARVLDSIHRV